LYSGNADEFVHKIIDFKPTMLRGYTSSLYYLAQVMSGKGVKLNVKSVSTTGETMFDFQRELIESFYGCRAHDGYGGEGMEIAGQCETEPGYHVNAESVVLEVVDSEGQACPDGVEGQIVLTDLNHYSMPFIRYNIQDMGVRSGKACACGRGLPVLDRIAGRLTDIGVTPSGKPIFVQFFSIVLRGVVSKVRGFQVVQERPDLITLYVVPGDGFDEVRQEVVAKAQDYVGGDVRVELKTVDDIPLAASGKRRLFISKCGIQVAGGDEVRADNATAR
jgi:phenylacetate-CoA ligase